MTTQSALRTAAVVVIGDEVLSAKLRDENGAFALQTLRAWGVAVQRMSVVRDVPDDIIREVNDCRARYDLVFTSGGIGPTHDDVTIASVASALGVAVVRHPTLVAAVKRYYGEALNEAHLRLAEVPDGSELIYPEPPTIPVMRAGKVFILPGVPELFRQLFLGLESRLRGPGIHAREILLSCDEPEIAAHLTTVQQSTTAAIGSYPQLKGRAAYRTKITVESTDEAEVSRVVTALLAGFLPGVVLSVGPLSAGSRP